MSQKILFVEDNENNRSLFKDMLSFHGYEVSVQRLENERS